MQDHECFCTKCRPGLFPTTIRMSTRHFAARFGDTEGYDDYVAAIEQILLNGTPVDLTHLVDEVCPGTPGWVIHCRQPRHPCESCMYYYCQEARFGTVEVIGPDEASDLWSAHMMKLCLWNPHEPTQYAWANANYRTPGARELLLPPSVFQAPSHTAGT